MSPQRLLARWLARQLPPDADAWLVKSPTFDVPPAPYMLMVKNDDRPGVIGIVGTVLGNAGVNIADMDVGRAAVPGTAVMLISPTAVVEASVVDELRSAPGIISVVVLTG